MRRRTDVNALDGVRGWRRMTVKCQKDTSVTRRGEAFLNARRDERNHCHTDARVLPNTIEKRLNPIISTTIDKVHVRPTHLNDIVQALVLQFLFADLQDTGFEVPLPGHKLCSHYDQYATSGETQEFTFNIFIAPRTSFIRAIRSSRAFMRLSCATTTTLLA